MQIKRLCQQVGGLGAAMALLFCSFSAWAGDDHHRSDGDSPPPIATPTNVDALWIAESNGVIKVSTAAGRVILAIPDADKIESIAVDEPRTTLWAVGRGQLTAFGFDGRTLLSLPIPPQSSEHGDKKHDQESSSEHNDPASLAVDESDGSVWVGQGKAVYGVDATGQVISKIQQNRNVTALAVDGERGTVWVADERGVAVQVQADTGLAGLLRPGMVVGVVATLDAPSPEAGGGSGRGSGFAKAVLDNLRVVYVPPTFQAQPASSLVTVDGAGTSASPTNLDKGVIVLAVPVGVVEVRYEEEEQGRQGDEETGR